MKKTIVLFGVLGVLYGCGSGDGDGIDGSGTSSVCANNSKVVRVIDENEKRDSYHFFSNTCNSLMYTGSIDTTSIWGYGKGLPDTGYWNHNSETFTLTRDSDQFYMFAGVPRLPSTDEKNQGALVCKLEAFVDGEYSNDTITVFNYTLNEYCFENGTQDPIISNYGLDYSMLSQAQINQFEDVVINGNPTAKDLNQALNNGTAKVCTVSSDAEINNSECAK